MGADLLLLVLAKRILEMNPRDGGAVDVFEGVDDLVEGFCRVCLFDDDDPDPLFVPCIRFVDYNVS